MLVAFLILLRFSTKEKLKFNEKNQVSIVIKKKEVNYFKSRQMVIIARNANHILTNNLWLIWPKINVWSLMLQRLCCNYSSTNFPYLRWYNLNVSEMKLENFGDNWLTWSFLILIQFSVYQWLCFCLFFFYFTFHSHFHRSCQRKQSVKDTIYCFLNLYGTSKA